MKKKNIIVTGGAGYIGSHACKALFQNNFNPVTIDNLSTGNKSAVQWGPLVKCDISNTKKLRKIFIKYKPIAVMHFASSCYVRESVENPILYYKNNFINSFKLINTMIDCKIKNIIFSSTCAIYGDQYKEKIKEEFVKDPINPYGKTKLMIENLLEDLSNQNKIKYISLRYFNAAGADSENQIGELHNPETHLIPCAINSGLKKKKLTIFGKNFKTKDGTAIRDYIYIEDLVKAHLYSLKYLLNKKKSNCFNLGSGKGYSVYEVVKFLKKNGLNIKFKYAKAKSGDPTKLVADNKKIKKILHWNPSRNNLNKILSTAISWHKNLI